MKKPESKKRDLLLSDDISPKSAENILKDIFEINAADDQKEETYKDRQRQPIRLFVNSYGGSVYDGLALVDVIRHSKTPVLQAALIAEITGKSLVKEETLRDYISRKAEWYIPAKEAPELKLADGYYE